MHARPICSSVVGGGRGISRGNKRVPGRKSLERYVMQLDREEGSGEGGMKSAGIKMKFLKLVGNSKFPRRTANARKRNRARDPREVIGSRDQPVRFSLMAACGREGLSSPLREGRVDFSRQV